MLKQLIMESIDFDTPLPSVHTWVRLQWTGQILYFSVVFIICMATVHRRLSLWPGQGNSDVVQTQSKRHSLPWRAYTLESWPALGTSTFLCHIRKKNHEMKHNHERLKAVKRIFHISDQGPNSKLLEYFKSALYVISQVIKFLSLLKCWIPD